MIIFIYVCCLNFVDDVTSIFIYVCYLITLINQSVRGYHNKETTLQENKEVKQNYPLANNLYSDETIHKTDTLNKTTGKTQGGENDVVSHGKATKHRLHLSNVHFNFDSIFIFIFN